MKLRLRSTLSSFTRLTQAKPCGLIACTKMTAIEPARMATGAAEALGAMRPADQYQELVCIGRTHATDIGPERFAGRPLRRVLIAREGRAACSVERAQELLPRLQVGLGEELRYRHSDGSFYFTRT